MTDIRLNSIRISPPFKIKVVGNKLSFPPVLIHNICLPAKKLVYQHPLKFFKFRPQTSVNGSSHIRKILPRIDTVAPIVQPEFIVHGIQAVAEFPSQILYKFLLYVFPRSSVILCLIIKLETNDAFSVRSTFHQLTDYPLTVAAVCRMSNIHNLARSVDPSSLYRNGQNIRMRFDHPCRNSIGRRADNYTDSGLLHGIHNPFHMRKIEDSLLRFAGAPC